MAEIFRGTLGAGIEDGGALCDGMSSASRVSEQSRLTPSNEIFNL
jgi:hypothetical protein